MISKSDLLSKLSTFARQRPGLDYGNYGDPVAYRAEVRTITRSLHDFYELQSAISWRDSITAEVIIEAAKRAYSGRLSIADNGEIDYCTGQYWPTEYRNAVCAVLAHCLWVYWREDGDKPRETAKKELTRGVVRRWFN